MIRTIRSAVVALTFILHSAWALASEPVDLLIVLAADVSRSIDQQKFQFQRQGYAAAVANPQVLKAIISGINRRIAVCFVEFSRAQKLVIDWTLIDGEAAAQRFSDQLLEAPRSFVDSTSISGGIDFAIAQFDRAPYEAERRTIDVSGDGDNNSGRPVTWARDEAVAKGVTINGLVILTEISESLSPSHTNPPGGIENYYRDNVIGGPGAFVIVAENFNSFGQAITKKLITEIAQIPPAGAASLNAAD